MESVRKIRKKEIEEWGIDSIGWRHGHLRDEGPEPYVKGYRDWRDFPNITKALKSRGYSSEQIIGILGQNFLRVFRDAVG
jgi:microsomal dipeptidase-like Zn-dependent dipeptidase